MYLRETRRTNRDGSVVSYLQLAHNERHPDTGTPVAKVIHNFGRADTVDRDGLARLVSSISRFLTPEQAVAVAHDVEVEVLDSRRVGGSWTLDRLWERLGIGAAIRRVAKRRRLDGEAVERVIFALVAQRALEPGSKLAATGWVAVRVAIEGCAGFSDDQAYRGMDFLLAALDEIASEVFASVAHLLNLDLDIVFVDTTSTYWEVEGADQVADLADTVDDDEVTRPAEQAKRTFGHSKDFRTDLPQVVIAMAVTRDGTPIRCWTFPGNQNDTAIIRKVKDDLAGWNLRRMVWVADRGFASAANRAYLTRGGGHYIHAEKLRRTNTEAAAALARPGRYARVAGNLRVKEIHVAPGGKGDGDDGARTQRFVVCHNPEQGERDEVVRSNLIAHLGHLIAHLGHLIDGSDTWTARKRDELVGAELHHGRADHRRPGRPDPEQAAHDCGRQHRRHPPELGRHRERHRQRHLRRIGAHRNHGRLQVHEERSGRQLHHGPERIHLWHRHDLHRRRRHLGQRLGQRQGLGRGRCPLRRREDLRHFQDNP